QARQWEYFEGSCYYFSLSRMSWHKAKAECEEMRSHLIIIDSYAKQVRKTPQKYPQKYPKTGHTKPHFSTQISPWGHMGPYKTPFRHPNQPMSPYGAIQNPISSPRFWKEGEPNNRGFNEDCAHVWTSGQWNDVYCTFECYYVCEKPLPK
ncbi:hepatic lectin-like, partial [Meleagris gallopavo]|uniref:hepatic lectin-like n=1 Tax=Meleagris gallopavo TaxID=9103 RepID=UPI0012ABA8D0